MRLHVPKLQEWVERHTKMRLLPSVYRQLAAALNAGKHVILIGPPGTGKTTLAHSICDYARNTAISAGSVPTTASADWTTFDTVGGYALTPDQALEFRPGIFLRAISKGRWLVIDEINRAEIDKAVGELFTLLSGQQVDLPYRIAGQRVRILPPKTPRPTDWIPDDASTYDYVVHPNWRILATMNVYDKSSLFSMSFAFMRRFAFIDVGVPHHNNIFNGLRAKWIEDRLGSKTNPVDREAVIEKMNEIFDKESPLMRQRELGPAIANDMLHYIEDRVSQEQEEQAALQAAEGMPLIEFLGEAFLLYAVPQLDGLDKEAVLKIYGQIDAIFNKVNTNSDIQRRIEDLYPHIRGDEWKAILQPTSG
jgi:MoxR-like ATPase